MKILLWYIKCPALYSYIDGSFALLLRIGSLGPKVVGWGLFFFLLVSSRKAQKLERFFFSPKLVHISVHIKASLILTVILSDTFTCSVILRFLANQLQTLSPIKLHHHFNLFKSSGLLILLQLNLVWWHIIINWIVLWMDWITLLWSWPRSQEKLRIPVNIRVDDISSTAEPFVTKLGMVMHHHGPECHAKRFLCCFQVQAHKEGSYNQIWLFLPIWLDGCCVKNSSRLRNRRWWWFVFEIRVTMKVQNFIESLCTLYLLCHWSLGNQTRFVDFLLTKPSTMKWACTYSSTLDYSIARHIAWDYFAVLGDNACLFRNHSDGLHWSPKMNAFDGWKFLREISLYIQCTHMFGSHNCGILKPGIVMS